jgi:WD40 repeat protein
MYAHTYTAAFSPDGKKIVTVAKRGDTASIWDVETGKELLKLDVSDEGLRDESFRRGAFFPDGKKLLRGGGESAFGMLRRERNY